MRSDEVRDTGTLLSTALDEVAELTRDVHAAVSGRVFRLLGSRAAPARLMHDGISSLVYRSTRLGLRTLPAAVGATAALRTDPAAPSAHDRPGPHLVLGALSGLRGDRIAVRQAALAPLMRIRTHDGRLRRLAPNVSHDAAGSATGRVVLFLHGLCENDRCWLLGAERAFGDPSATYGSLLRDADGWTPLYVDYNSGLHISENGRELAAQLDQLVASWPVPVTEIALVGHSMGGLVARSAAHQADQQGLAWRAQLRHVIGLGSPHLGAPLERAVAAGTRLLGQAPETRPFATWLNLRSVGIKDLRHGAILTEDWSGVDPDLCSDDRCTPAVLLPGVDYAVVSATLSRHPTGPFAHDLLVQHGSAHGIGKTRRIDFGADRLFHVGGRHHFRLLADPLIAHQLRTWLGPAAAPQPVAGEPGTPVTD